MTFDDIVYVFDYYGPLLIFGYCPRIMMIGLQPKIWYSNYNPGLGRLYTHVRMFESFLNWVEETPYWLDMCAPGLPWMYLINNHFVMIRKHVMRLFLTDPFIEGKPYSHEFFSLRFKDNWYTLLEWGTTFYKL